MHKIAINPESKTLKILNSKLKKKKVLAKIIESPYYKFESIPALTE